MAKKVWRLEGFDTFSQEFYHLYGEYSTEEEAYVAADKRLKELEKTQPTSHSGGQRGIQDRVYIIKPDGTKSRFWRLKGG